MADLQVPASSANEATGFPFSDPSTRNSQWLYDVFINHRGPDVKNTTASVLYQSLIGRGLSVFLDSEEFELVDRIPDKIQQAIRSSRVQIAILSKNYARSAWCLAELALMFEINALIVPLFDHVSPSVIRHCTGAYAEAFHEHESKGRYSKMVIDEWKNALHKVSEISGCVLNESQGDQGKVWEEIANTVLKEVMRRSYLKVADHPVGLEEAVYDFDRRRERENNPKLVGIVGMCGSGKTTLAKHFFNLKHSDFDGSCFCEESALNNLPTLQRNILKMLLNLDLEIDSVSEGKAILRSRFAKVETTSRFLIILDGIDHKDQVDALLVGNVLQTDSLIIITSRDRSVFTSLPEAMLYEMKTMDKKHGRELFCWHAFNQPSPVIGSENVVDGFVRKCDGLPLLLKEFGALLHGKPDKKEWELVLRNLSKEPNKDIKTHTVNAVLKELKRRSSLEVAEHPVGLDEDVENFERKVAEFAKERQKNAKLVAIVGTGGSGKTTLAKQLFNVKRSAFDAACFLYVREASAMHRLQALQGKLLKELLHLDYEIYNKSHGKEILRSRFATVRTTSRFLIVLDDVDHNDQIDDLLVEDVLRTSSLIIITSRDNSLFGSRPEAILYEMKTMDEKHARELFCLHAFHQCYPVDGFKMDLVEGFLSVCDGLPLSLEVCGTLLYKEYDMYKWELQLNKLLEVPNRDIKNKLQISYEALENDEKMMLLAYEGLAENVQDAFMDICWFFGGWEWETVASIVGEVELQTLSDIHLVTRDLDKVRMCYTAVRFSRKISKGLRITTTEEVSSVLKQEQNVDEIKGIWLMDNNVRFELPAEKLDQMHRSLRVLALGDWTVIKDTCNNRFQSLRFLQAGNVPNLPFKIANLDHLRLLHNGSGQEMGFNAAENIPTTLRKLEMCQRHFCSGLELTSQVVISLQNLRSLGLKEFVGLFSLPKEFQLLSQLTRLDLTGCSLLKLPKGIGQLNTLKHLNLSRCEGLKELPGSIGQIQSLRTLNLQFCTKLSQIPETFGLLERLRILNLKGCRSLQRLPECFGLLSSLEDLNLCGCINLRFLPSSFEQLRSLRALNLKKCQNLLDLPYNIGNLPLISFNMKQCSKLRSLPSSMERLTSLLHRYMSMNGCFALKELPEELCQLKYTERLDLSCSIALKRLPDRLMDMASLTYLNLEKCENIVNLPEGFGKLNSLQILILNSCIKLENLCGDFESLISLEKLIMRNCPIIEGKWMDTVVKIGSLKLVEITESWKLTERWTEIRSEENEWDMNVKFYQADGDAEKEMMRKAASMFFSDECLLFNAYGCKIRPSTLVPNTTLVFVFDRHVSENGWEQVVGNIKALHNSSLDFQIIHITNYSPNLVSLDNQERILEPKGTTLSLSFKSIKVLLAFKRILSEVVSSTELQSDYVVSTTVEEDNKGIKHFSRWKNISGLLKQIIPKSETLLRIKKQLRTPEGNNLESLRALLVTEGRDFLLNKDTEQVKVDALRGLKLVLLLVSRIEVHEIEISILKEMYTKLRDKEYEFEMVWMPIVNLDSNDTWGSYVRVASSMPWLAVADPWSMEPAVLELVKQDWDFGHDSSSKLVAVDEKGRISNKDAMGMVWRWGLEAYPFAGDSWDDLLEAEWEELNNKSSLEFLFQNLESLSEVVEAMLQGRMIWLYGGDPLEIPDFTLMLNDGLRGLDASNIQIIYIGGPSFPSAVELMNKQEIIFHENNRQDISWSSLPFPDALRFWRRVECLLWEMRDKGDHEMFKRLRKLLVALLSVNNISRTIPEAAVWIVAMDEKGEMATARGKDVINYLVLNSASPSAQELETTEELIEGSRRGKLTQIIKKRFQEGTNFTSQHHPQHPLLPFTAEYYPWPGVICDACDKEIMAELSFFKCSICEDINICEVCMGLSHGLLGNAAFSSAQRSNLMESPWPALPTYVRESKHWVSPPIDFTREQTYDPFRSMMEKRRTAFSSAQRSNLMESPWPARVSPPIDFTRSNLMESPWPARVSPPIGFARSNLMESPWPVRASPPIDFTREQTYDVLNLEKRRPDFFNREINHMTYDPFLSMMEKRRADFFNQEINHMTDDHFLSMMEKRRPVFFNQSATVLAQEQSQLSRSNESSRSLYSESGTNWKLKRKLSHEVPSCKNEDLTQESSLKSETRKIIE